MGPVRDQVFMYKIAVDSVLRRQLSPEIPAEQTNTSFGLTPSNSSDLSKWIEAGYSIRTVLIACANSDKRQFKTFPQQICSAEKYS